jgi:hypothetical protein
VATAARLLRTPSNLATVFTFLHDQIGTPDTLIKMKTKR